MRAPLGWTLGLGLLAVVACDGGPTDPAPTGSSVALGTDALTLQLGDSAALSLTGAKPGRPVYWTSRDRRIFTVTADGLVRSVSPGTAWLLASSDNAADSTRITVNMQLAEIHAGIDMTCGRTTRGYALCWGWNLSGVLAVGDRDDRLVPSSVVGGHSFGSLWVRGTTTCGRSLGSGLLCWGWNGTGQIADGTIFTRTEPVSTTIPEDLRRVATGSGATLCGFTGTAVLCWGWNGYNQLLTGTTMTRRLPGPLDAGRPLRDIANGGGHVCGLDLAGAAWCWGRGEAGQLGNGSTAHTAAPVAVTGGRVYAQIATGYDHSCGREATGDVWCWGASQTVAGDTTAGRPRLLAGGIRFDTIVAAESHGCGLAAGTAWCWGTNANGQLGTGGSTAQLARDPLPVTGGLRFVQISTGSRHSCGLADDGYAYCWGENLRGALGDGSRITRLAPVRVAFQR